MIEIGVTFLLFFTPFAFGGVELWAKGVVQIITGVVGAAWLLGSRQHRERGVPLGRARTAALGVPIGLFLLLVFVQLLPLSPAWIARLAPGTHDLYERALPGYSQGRPFQSADLVPWLLADAGAIGADPVLSTPEPASLPSLFPTSAPVNRPLSIYPAQTRDRLMQLLCWVGLFAVVAGHYVTTERRMRLLATAVFSGLAVSVIGIIQQLTWNGKLLWIREGNYLGVFGPFVNRNSYAAFAGTLVPVALALALEAAGRTDRRRGETLPRVVLWSFAAMAIWGGVFLSLSRGGILTTGLSIFAMLLFLLAYSRRTFELIVLGGVVLFCVGFLVWIGPEQVVERLGSLSEGQNVATFADRWRTWSRVLLMIDDHRALGTGLGTFRFAFMRFAPPAEGWWTTAHNEYLEVVTDTGVAGALLVATGLAAYLLLVVRPRLRDHGDRYLYAGMAAGLAGLLTHSIANSSLQVPANGLLVAVLGALLLRLVVDRGARRRPGPTP